MSQPAAPVVRITPAEAHNKMIHDGFTYVDVRTPEEFAEGRPAGAINVPFDDAFVDAMEKAFPKDARLIIGCQAGRQSLRAARALVTVGFTHVVEQRAGF